jgi:hypothetical protein
MKVMNPSIREAYRIDERQQSGISIKGMNDRLWAFVSVGGRNDRTSAALTPLPLLFGHHLFEIGCRLPGNHGNIPGSGEVGGADAVVNGPDPVEGNAYLTAPCGSQLPPDIGSNPDRNPILFN